MENKIVIYPKRLIMIMTLLSMFVTTGITLIINSTNKNLTLISIIGGLGFIILLDIILFISNRLKLKDNILYIQWDIGKVDKINIKDIVVIHHFKTFMSEYSLDYMHNNHLESYYFEDSKFTNKDLNKLFNILTDKYQIEYRDLDRNDTLHDKNISEDYCVIWPDAMFSDKICFSIEFITKYKVKNIKVLIVDEKGNVLITYIEDNGDFSSDGKSKITYSDVISGQTYFANIIGDVYERETTCYDKILKSFPFYINKRKRGK